MGAIPPLRQSIRRWRQSGFVWKGIQSFQRGLSSVHHRWQSLQVSYRGHRYSVERLLALDEYTKNTSLLRVGMVVSGTLVPMVALVVSQESVPLDDPREGWRVNYGFWVRVGILAGVVSSTLVIQLKSIVRTATFSKRQFVLLFSCQGLSYPIASMGIADCVGFPIPFFALSTIPIFFLLCIAWFTIIAGRKSVQQILEKSKYEMSMYVQFIGTKMLLPVVYPIYEVMFYAASDTYYELPVILLLPVIKVFMKYIITLTLTGMEDMMPEAVIFTVDFFHAVYLATCMQRTRSTITVAILIAVDVSQSVSMLYGLHRQSRTMLARVHRSAEILGTNEALVSSLRVICTSSELLSKQNIIGVRVRSCLPHILSHTSQQMLNLVEKLQLARRASRRASSRSYCSGSSTSVIPLKMIQHTHISRMRDQVFWWRRGNIVKPTIPTSISIIPITEGYLTERRRSSRQNSLACRRSNILLEGLETLFTTECLVLVSYLHTSIAMFYANFIVVMVYLPSAQYHTELTGVTPANVANTVEFVFIFGILEFISFALLAVMLHSRYGMQAFYHLAFVLEIQVELVQSKVMMWMLIILAFRVVHFGTYNLENEVLISRCSLLGCTSRPLRYSVLQPGHFARLRFVQQTKVEAKCIGTAFVCDNIIINPERGHRPNKTISVSATLQ